MKTILIISAGVALLFFIALTASLGIKKAWAFYRWFLVFFLVGLFGVATTSYSLPLILFLVFTKGMNLFLWIWLFLSAFALPLALLLKNVKFNPFWFWLDDSRFSSIRESGYAEDYEIYLDGKKETIWTAYGWHMRNRVWNLDNWLSPTKGKQVIAETVIDNLIMNGKKVDQSLSWIPMARLKYWKNGVEGSNINTGNKISKKHSITGEGFVWTSDGKRLGFRYSFCEIRPFLFFWKRWRILVFGENDKRPVFSIKHKKIKEWQ